jgi:chaperone required for assembly of F1-ATPase
MSDWKQVKRFYQNVAVAKLESGFGVALDGKPVNTPAANPLAVPTETLAVELVAEWEAQTESLEPASMPHSKMAATAIDRVSSQRDQVIAVTLKFAETDLLCYRAEEPPELVARQARDWQPLLDWAREELGADLRVTSGVVPVNQPYTALAALTERVSGLTDHELMAVSSAAAVTGSLVLGLTVYHGRVSAESAGDLALLDEVFQMEQWGQDAEAMARQRAIRREIQEAAHYLQLLSV